jgi:hypothetical protein
MSVEQQQNTINNIVTHMSGIEGTKKARKITNRQLSLWYRVDGRLGQCCGRIGGCSGDENVIFWKKQNLSILKF